MASPSWRAPTTITAISHVRGFGQSVTSAIAAAMVPQAGATSHMPRDELREVSRLHSAGVKTFLGPTRATTGIGTPLRSMIRRYDCTSIRGAGHNVDLRGEGAMHGAFVRDFHQLVALFGIQRALHRDDPIDLIEHPGPGFAVRAVFRMNLAVLQRHRDALQR